MGLVADMIETMVRTEGIDMEEAAKIMLYVTKSGYNPTIWLSVWQMGGSDLLYFNAWVCKTFNPPPFGGTP